MESAQKSSATLLIANNLPQVQPTAEQLKKRAMELRMIVDNTQSRQLNTDLFPAEFGKLQRSFLELGRRPVQIQSKSIKSKTIILNEQELAGAFNTLAPSQIKGARPSLALANPQPPSVVTTEKFDAIWNGNTFNVDILEQENFVCRPFFARGRVTGTAAPGGVGKSLIALYEACCIVMGHDPYSDSQIKPERVLYWNLEDTVAVSNRRIAALIKHNPNRFAKEVLHRDLLVAGADTGDLQLAHMEGSAVVIPEDTVKVLIERIRANGIAMVVLDPLASLHGLEENDNGGMDRLAKQGLARIAREANCAVHIIHHSGKGLQGNFEPTDMFRGASSITSAMRMTRAIYRIPWKDAAAKGFEGITDSDVLEMKVGKQNIVPGRECYPRYFRSHEVLLRGEASSPSRITEAALTWTNKREIEPFRIEHPAEVVRRVIQEGELIDARRKAQKWIGKGILAACGIEYEQNSKGTVTNLPAVHDEQIGEILAEQVRDGVIREVEGRNSSGNQARFFELIEPPLEREQDGETLVDCDVQQRQPRDP